MTVEELISRLKLYPDHYRVILRADELDFMGKHSGRGHRKLATVAGHIDLQAVVLGPRSQTTEPAQP